MKSAPPKAGTSAALLVVSALVVYLVTPALPISAQGSSAGIDQLYVVDGNGGLLYRASTDGTTDLVGTLTMPGCPDPFNILIAAMDTAPDGTLYGFVRCGGGPLKWGRLDPETAAVTVLSDQSSIPFQGTGPLARPNLSTLAFRAEVGAAGSPIGYRFRWQNRGAIYAIDALSPYREHLLIDGPIMPVAFNSGIGAVMSPAADTFFTVTVDASYRIALHPLGTQFSVARYYGNLDISTDAVVAGIDGDGYYSIVDGITLYRVKPTAPTDVVTGVQLHTINFATAAFLHRAPHGGVRVEPHEQLTTSEAGATATFTAVLTKQPTADVTVSFASDTSEGTVSPASATFTTSDWNTPQTITVTGVNDNDAGNTTYSIVTTTSSADPNYNDRGVIAVTVTNTNVNQAPSLTPATPSVVQGSIDSPATLGAVADFETAAGSLAVTTVTVPSGVTVAAISNTSGTIAAPLSATCSAPTGSQTLKLRVTDENSASTDQDVTLTVLANIAPTLGTYNATSIVSNAGTTVSPSAAPGDNGSIASIEATSATFTGTLSASTATGIVTVGNAAPVGVHTITVTVTDNCGATFSRTFDLTVTCPTTASLGAPGISFTAGGGAASVDVTMAPGCDWSSSSSASWVTFTSGSGTGDGSASFKVDGNRTDDSRTADLTIGGQPFTITQSNDFTPVSITAGVTLVQAIHFEELRIRIDRARIQHGLSAFAWTNPNLAPGVPVRVVHINELRTALLQVYEAAALPEPIFTDGLITSSTTIKALHFTEIVSAVDALKDQQ